MPRIKVCFEQFRSAAGSGAALGVFLGHLDLTNRILSKNFEWFEFYLALLFPVLVCSGLFVLIAACVEILRLIKILKAVPIAAYRRLGFLLGIFVSVFIIIHLTVFQEILIWSPRHASQNGWIAIVAVALSLGASLIKLRFKSISEWGRGYLNFILLFVVFNAALDLYIQLRIPSPSETEAADTPNLVLITLDTVRADHLSLHGYDKITSPNIDKIAMNGVVFDNAQAVSSWTLPSHATLFTGKYPYNHRAIQTHQKLDSHAETLAEILRKRGYATAAFVGGPYMKQKYGVGQGFDLYADRLDYFEYRHTSDQLSIKRLLDFFSFKLALSIFGMDGERGAQEINHDAFKWMDKIGRQPFFLFINYFDAHDPYTRGAEYIDGFLPASANGATASRESELSVSRRWSADLINREVRKQIYDTQGSYEIKKTPAYRDYMVAMYDAEIHSLDLELQRLIDKLNDLNLLDNTILIITSDHGEEFYEHGGIMHKQTLYREVLHVPLIISYPRKLKPARHDTLVSLVDVFPTALSLIGMQSLPGMDGANLMPLINEAIQPSREFVLAQLYGRTDYGESDLRSVIRNDWKYIHVTPERERVPRSLFDLRVDPTESENLIAVKSQRASEMSHELQSSINESTFESIGVSPKW